MLRVPVFSLELQVDDGELLAMTRLNRYSAATPQKGVCPNCGGRLERTYNMMRDADGAQIIAEESFSGVWACLDCPVGFNRYIGDY